MMNSLLAGGVVAAMVAGWAQVKGFFSYVSGFFVVNVSLNDSASEVLLRYIRTKWRLLPSGKLYYAIRYFTFKGLSHSTLVPYKVPPTDSIYYKKGCVLFLSGSREKLKIKFFRGTINFDQFVIDATLAWEDDVAVTVEKEQASYNRYQVIVCTGREKNQLSFNQGVGSNSNLSTVTPSASDSPVSADTPYLDTSRDRPLMYDRSMWDFNEFEDPFQYLWFPAAIKKNITNAQTWLNKGSWYAERGIPWRRGWLLHGPGGTGKSSLAKAVAQCLRIPIYQFYLATLSDQEFIHKWNEMNAPCIALLEDFDAVFHGREAQTEHKLLTFDCVLNQISGVNSLSGVFVMVTTNRLDMIDPAIGVTSSLGGVSSRPGRIDTVIEVSYLENEGKVFIANKILRDWPDAIERVLATTEQVTPAQFQELCIQEAFKYLEH